MQYKPEMDRVHIRMLTAYCPLTSQIFFLPSANILNLQEVQIRTQALGHRAFFRVDQNRTLTETHLGLEVVGLAG